MKKSKRTVDCKKVALAMYILNWVLCFGLAIALVIAFLITKDQAPTEDQETLQQKLGTIIYGIGLSLIPMVVLAIIVKDKIRPTVWMIDIILANYLFGEIAMYIVFVIWLVSEYVVGPVGKHYKNLYTINKEIDRRE
jgi:hypothetical protein